MFSIILEGMIGGALRGIVVVWEQINYGWFFVPVAVSMAIGIFAATFMEGNFRFEQK